MIPIQEAASIKFRPAILVVFLLATYSMVQLVIGFIVYLIFPYEIDLANSVMSFLSVLLILIMSNVLMIGFIMRIFSFSFEEKAKFESLNKLWLVILLIIAISFTDILTSIVDRLLDLIGINSSLISPYDQFFGDPVSIIAFTFLAAFVGPIFEELVYRRFTITAMSNLTESKTLLIGVSALIFAFSHISSDLLNGSLRYALLHLCATCLLGIILGIVYVLWGLKGAIFFHSSWNIFSLLVQLLDDNGFVALVDLLILLSACITLLCLILSFFHFKTRLRKLLFTITPFSANEFMLIFSNCILIIVYALTPAICQIILGQNLFTAGISLLLYTFGFLFGLIFLNKDNQGNQLKKNRLIQE